MSVLDSLNPQQKEAVKYFDGPSLIVAGPGSGKTRVLTHKIAYLIKERGVSPFEILGITFTNKAANEIKERVGNLMGASTRVPWLGTFHSMCARILRKEASLLGISPNYVIYDTDDQKSLIKHIAKDLDIPPRTNLSVALSSISSAKNELVTFEDYEKYAYGPFQKDVARIYREYQKRLHQSNALDFDDLIFKTIELFSLNEGLRDTYSRRFKYILIDEYQDTNHAQYVISKLLAKNHNNICAVGDMSQAIYSFRGADFRNILNFQRDYPAAKIFNLAQNYRSTKTIIDAAKNIIKHNDNHIDLDLWTQNDKGDLISLYEAEDEKEESLYIGFNIIDKVLKGSSSYKDFAVLYRTNAQSRSVEEQFIRLGIPYKLIGGIKFYSRKEIKDALSFLRVIQNPKDSVSWERIINTPPRGVGKKSVDDLSKSGWDLSLIEQKTRLPIKGLIRNKDAMPVVELLDKILDVSGYNEYLNDGTEEGLYRLENLKELKSVASQFLTLEDFLENVSLVEALDVPTTNNDRSISTDKDTVTLMTLHSAKGLEFKEVFIIGMEEGLLPHSKSLFAKEDIEEERRLCYVGITRAKEKIHLTYTRSRLYLGSMNSNIVSRFVSEIPGEYIRFNTKSGMQTIHMDKGLEKYLDNLEDSRDFNL